MEPPPSAPCLPRFDWVRKPARPDGRLGPLQLERVALVQRPHALGTMIEGEVEVLATVSTGVAGATLQLWAREAAGVPVATDWEPVPTLGAGAQATIAVRWIVEDGLQIDAIAVGLSVSRPHLCHGGSGLEAPAACGPVQLRALGIAVEPPDDDGDSRVCWRAEVHNPGPPLTEVELLLEVAPALPDPGAAAGDDLPGLHRERLAAPPLATGTQVLAFELWAPRPGPFLHQRWTLSLATPVLHGPLVVPAVRA